MHRRSFTTTVFILGVMLIPVLLSCGGGSDEAASVDTLSAADTTAEASRDSVVADTTLGELLEQSSEREPDHLASDRAQPDERASSEDSPPTAREPAADSPPLASRYQLASVNGSSLPVVLVEGPDCVVELTRGEVRIRDDHTFNLRTFSHENCAGEIRNDQVHQASGTVVRDGERLRFDATDGEAFAVAHGRYQSEGRIVIDRLEFEGGEHDVRWEFAR